MKKYYIFDNGLEFIISSDSSFKDQKQDIVSCVGELVPIFSDYVKECIDDGMVYEFDFLNGNSIKGSFSDAVLNSHKIRENSQNRW